MEPIRCNHFHMHGLWKVSSVCVDGFTFDIIIIMNHMNISLYPTCHYHYTYNEEPQIHMKYVMNEIHFKKGACEPWIIAQQVVKL